MIRRAAVVFAFLVSAVPVAHASGPAAVVCSFKGTMSFELFLVGHDPAQFVFGGSGSLPGYCAAADAAGPTKRIQRATASFERWSVDLDSHPSPPPTGGCQGGALIMDFDVTTATGSSFYELASVVDWPGIQGQTPIAGTGSGVFTEGIFGKCPPLNGTAQVALTFVAAG